MALLLATLWLAAYRFADITTVFDRHSSLWFLPAGVILTTVLVAPGWLKASPLFASLLLLIPDVQAALGIEVKNPIQFQLHSIRLFVIYGGAAFLLVRVAKISLPIRQWRDVQWFLAIGLGAATLATMSALPMHVLADNMTWHQAVTEIDSWWIGDSLGVIMLPPLLVPLLMRLMGQSLGEWHWPAPGLWLIDFAVIAAATVMAAMGPSLGLNLWYSLIPPALVFALYGGYERGASAVLMTCLLAPPIVIAFVEPAQTMALQAPLLTMAVAALLVGAATTDRARMADHLRDMVARRTEELEKAYQLQRHLVRSLGHDLRQPVEAINLTLDGLAQHPERAPGNNLERLRTLGAMASDLLTRILTYARLDTGEVRPELTPFSSRELIKRLKTLYGPQAQRRSLTMEWPGTELIVVSDRELLFQVLSNLLDNAIRLSSPGDRIAVEIEETQDQVGFFVTDAIEPSPAFVARPGGLGLRIVAQAALLLGAGVVDEQNRKGIILPLKR